MDNNDTREVAEIIENAMREFNESMFHREQLSIRIGRVQLRSSASECLA